MASSLVCALGLVASTLLRVEEEPELVRCRSAIRHGEATIEIVQTHRVRGSEKGEPHACRAEVVVRGPSGEFRRVYSDIDAVGDRFGVAILPDPIGSLRAIAKLGDYDGRLLLVGRGGGVVDLPGPSHYLAHARYLILAHHSDVYGVTIYDISASVVAFAADDAVLAALLGAQVGDPARWVEIGGTIYLSPQPSGAGHALRLDKTHGGLVPARLSPADEARARLVHFRGLEGWRDCSCGSAKALTPSARPPSSGGK